MVQTLSVVAVCCLVAQLCLFETPQTVAYQATLSVGFSRQEYWSGLPFPSPGDLPDPGIEPKSTVSPALACRLFTTEPPETDLKQQRHQTSLISVQFSRSVVSDSLWPHESQHARPPCPSPTPRVYPNSCSIDEHRLVVPSSHLILCHPLLLLAPIPPSIRVFSNESTLRMRWPKYWSFNLASVLPMNTQGWSPLGRTGWISLQSKGSSRVFSNTTVQNIYINLHIYKYNVI